MDDRPLRITRPRLCERVSPRRHIVDGKEFVVLHVDGESTLIRIAPREWSVLEAADGTRDVEGITLAARRLGGHAAANRVAQFLSGLESRGLLEEGPPTHHPTAVSMRARSVPDDRPLEVLPDYLFECDGSGGCCRFYATILFGPGDVARAHAYVPDHSAGIVPTERLFTPARGSAPTPIVVPVQNEGACGFLGADDRCEIHRAGGLAAKPVGCAAFPLRLCDDGTAVRVTPSTECGCALRSAVEARGEPLVPLASSHVRDLPIVSAIESLPEKVPLAGDRWMERADLRACFSELLAALPVDDAAVWLWMAANMIEHGAPGAPPSGHEVAPWAQALADVAKARAARDSEWRSRTDVTMRGLVWMATSAVALTQGDLLDALLQMPPSRSREENGYVRSTLWGYVDVADAGVVTMLRDRAMRIWLARAMPELATEQERIPVFAHPLATVDVLMRGHGLGRYAEKASGSTGSSAG